MSQKLECLLVVNKVPDSHVKFIVSHQYAAVCPCPGSIGPQGDWTRELHPDLILLVIVF